MPRSLKIFFHDNCFDGTASSAVFAAFYRAHVDARADVAFEGLAHKMGDPFEGHAFDADDHACVDFRYTPQLSWWFDHHQSAFQPPALRDHYAADDSGQMFYDPTAKANTSFMAGVLADQFGWRDGAFDELIHWAHIVDSADFPDARTAVELAQPALQLATWLEHNTDAALTRRYIAELGTRPLADIAGSDYVQEALVPVLSEHRDNVGLIERRAVEEAGVVYIDLLDDGVWAPNKFIAYMLFPASRYTVCLTGNRERAKVSVGANPWAPVPRTHDISVLCEQHGGGGHPVVGAVSLGAGEVDRARRIAADIRTALSSG